VGDTPAEPLYYPDYLQLDRLLSSQELASAVDGQAGLLRRHLRAPCAEEVRQL